MGEKECLTPKNIEFLVEYRGSVDTVRHEAEAEKYYVACNDTEIVGMVSVKKNEITKLYVHPLWHRKGVGQLLFEKAEEIIVKSGHTRIILGVIGESPVSFYKSMGMIVSGRKPLKLEHESVREVILMERLLK
ncbi:MAG: GNAT family N-acetyltransferase [Desulfobacteraceae bacterium]